MSVRATIDREQRLLVLELVLARRLIEHSTDGVFARDILRRGLRAALPAGDLAELAPLFAELERSETRPPPDASPAYRTFLGAQERCEQQLPSSLLRLENAGRDEAASLRVTLALRRAPEGGGD